MTTTRVNAEVLLPPKPWLALFRTDFAHLGSPSKEQTATSSQQQVSEGPSERNEPGPFHILSLPVEVTRHIFSKLEAEQLSIAAQVCRAWLAFAYEPHQWRRICYAAWPHEGQRNLEKRLYMYKNWRKLATMRPRIRTNAIYVMRNRKARTSSQASLYEPIAPVFLVTYYRLLRFYSDGTVVAYTSADPPHIAYRHVKRNGTSSKGVSVGEYRFEEETGRVHVRYPMAHKNYPNMVSGTIVMNFQLESTREGAFDRLLLTEHYAIEDGGGGIVAYRMNFCDNEAFKMVSLWGFGSRVYKEFPRDDEEDLERWFQMKRNRRRRKA